MNAQIYKAEQAVIDAMDVRNHAWGSYSSDRHERLKRAEAALDAAREKLMKIKAEAGIQ